MISGHVKPRILAIDYGTKRIGLAMSDPLHLFAQPVGTFTEADLIAHIQKLIQTEGVEKILLGLPVSLDGSENRMTGVVKNFHKRMFENFPGVDIIYVDEFGSSKSASGLLKQIGVPKKKRGKKGRLDKTVAAMLLENYLQQQG